MDPLLPMSGHEAELTYASAVTPTSLTTADFSPSERLDPSQILAPPSSMPMASDQAKRVRSTHGSSDDSGEPQSDDGFISKNLRVGGPYLCQFPADFVPISPTHPLSERLEQGQGRLTREISGILVSSTYPGILLGLEVFSLVALGGHHQYHAP
jgi:hypothetical protein